MLGQSQVQTSGRGSDDVMETRLEIAGNSPKVIGGLPVVCQELTESDRELVGSSSKVIESLPGKHREFAGG
ncbi:hypothetical protein GW17_00056374 [Ensete ventricosum]|nr:hypothetical protein GW17_00056374 [Ensete ventricosum]RZS22114.1 hypothetical protein BHM03_00054843 [Ensete ventricosum]